MPRSVTLGSLVLQLPFFLLSGMFHDVPLPNFLGRRTEGLLREAADLADKGDVHPI